MSQGGYTGPYSSEERRKKVTIRLKQQIEKIDFKKAQEKVEYCELELDYFGEKLNEIESELSTATEYDSIYDKCVQLQLDIGNIEVYESEKRKTQRKKLQNTLFRIFETLNPILHKNSSLTNQEMAPKPKN